MYIDMLKAGSDIILNFNKNPNEIHRMIKIISYAVKNGTISEERTDNSVRKILKIKGLVVKN